jgi:hypothetical protein
MKAFTMTHKINKGEHVMTISVGTRLIHNFRGEGQITSLFVGDESRKMMVVLFEKNGKTGIFDQDSENFIYEETGEHIGPVLQPFLKSKSARDYWREISNYWSYQGHEEFFNSTCFTKSIKSNPQDCWWLVGYLQTCGREAYHEPVNEATVEIQRRGPTRHNYFPDPCIPGLDAKVGEYFDFYRKGFVQINSVSLYDFLDAEPSPIAPFEYQDTYQAGRTAGTKAKFEQDKYYSE